MPTNILIFTLIASHIQPTPRGACTVTYIHANQTIPQRDQPPWAYSDIEQDLLFLAQPLPSGLGHALTIEPPSIELNGAWATVTQNLSYV